MIGEDDRGNGMRVLCVRRRVGWSGHGCGYGASVEGMTDVVDDDEGDRGERGGERRGERMKDGKGANFLNKSGGFDLVAELTRPCKNDQWARSTCFVSRSRQSLDFTAVYIISVKSAMSGSLPFSSSFPCATGLVRVPSTKKMSPLRLHCADHVLAVRESLHGIHTPI